MGRWLFGGLKGQSPGWWRASPAHKATKHSLPREGVVLREPQLNCCVRDNNEAPAPIGSEGLQEAGTQESALTTTPLQPSRSEPPNPRRAQYTPPSWGSSSWSGLRSGGSGHCGLSEGVGVGSFFPASGLLVALGGFSLGFLVALGGFSLGSFSLGCFSLGFLVALGGFSLGFLVALGGFSLGGFSLGFLGGLEDPSGGCLVALGTLSFFPFFPLSLAFPGGAVQDADSGQINEEPPLCPRYPPQGAHNLGKGAVDSSVFPKSRKLRG